MSNPVTHFEIVGKDAARLQRFYSEAFGWQMVPAGPSYAMAHPGNEHGINGGVGSAPEGGGGSMPRPSRKTANHTKGRPVSPEPAWPPSSVSAASASPILSAFLAARASPYSPIRRVM